MICKEFDIIDNNEMILSTDSRKTTYENVDGITKISNNFRCTYNISNTVPEKAVSLYQKIACEDDRGQDEEASPLCEGPLSCLQKQQQKTPKNKKGLKDR